jgi:hypothetical protein
MAKIAGRKNDGAWFRTNKDLVALTSQEQESLVTAIEGAENLYTAVSNAYAGITTLMMTIGILPADFPSSVQLWLLQLVKLGIPRQIWDGVTTYDVYTRSGSAGSYKYSKTLQPVIFLMSKYLRPFLKQWLFTNEEVGMLNNKVAPTRSASTQALMVRYGATNMRELRANVLSEITLSPPPLKIERKDLTAASRERKRLAPAARTFRTKGRTGARVGTV